MLLLPLELIGESEMSAPFAGVWAQANESPNESNSDAVVSLCYRPALGSPLSHFTSRQFLVNLCLGVPEHMNRDRK